MTFESDWAYVKDKVDWDHFCALVDNAGPPFRPPSLPPGRKDTHYAFYHSPEPDSYPCLVQAQFYDDPNGPYCMDHTYIYPQDAAKLIMVSVGDLMEQKEAYRKQAIDLMILLAEVDAKTAAEMVDKKVFNGRD